MDLFESFDVVSKGGVVKSDKEIKVAREATEEELVRLAKELGGGWEWKGGVIPSISLTIVEARALMGRLPDVTNFEDPTSELHYHLNRAERHAQTALNVCYRLENPAKRSFWFRAALGRAQSILMSIYVRDLKIEGRKFE